MTFSINIYLAQIQGFLKGAFENIVRIFFGKYEAFLKLVNQVIQASPNDVKQINFDRYETCRKRTFPRKTKNKINPSGACTNHGDKRGGRGLDCPLKILGAGQPKLKILNYLSFVYLIRSH